MKKYKFLLIPLIALPLIFAGCSDDDPDVPVTVTTGTIKNVSLTSAEFSAALTGSTVSDKGFCWNTTGTPTTSNDKLSAGSGAASFSLVVSGLSTGTTYYVRAYAVSGGTTLYGEEKSFTTYEVGDNVVAITSIDNVLVETASVKSRLVVTDGNTGERGIVYSDVNTEPTITDTKVADRTTGNFWVTKLEGLTPSTKYFVRPYIYSGDELIYGNALSFSTVTDQPDITTGQNVTFSGYQTTLSAQGITTGYLSDAEVESVGICLSLSPQPTIDDIYIPYENYSSDVTSFTIQTGRLVQGKTYYYRAYVRTQYGETYGEQRQFNSRSVIGDILVHSNASVPAPQGNVLIYTASSPGSSFVTPFQQQLWDDLYLVLSNYSNGRTLDHFRLYTILDSGGNPVISMYYGYMNAAGSTFGAPTFYKSPLDGNNNVRMGTDWFRTSNALTVYNGVAVQYKEILDDMCEWFCTTPMVIEFATDYSETIFNVYPEGSPDEVIVMTLSRGGYSGFPDPW